MASNWTNFVEWWDKMADGVKVFFNQPVPIIGCTVLSLLVFVLTVLSKTSWGKKGINWCKNQISFLVAGFKELKEGTEKEVKEIKEFSETERQKLEAQYSELSELIVAVAENSHNAKVKSALLKYKEKTDSIKTSFDSYVEEKVAQANDEKYKSQLDDLNNRINELLEKVENTAQNGEKELTTAFETKEGD